MGLCWATLARSQPGGRLAILAPNRGALTFERLATHLEETREQLRRLGIGPRDRVVLLLPDGSDAATALLAISSTAVAVPLDPRATRSEYDSLFLRLTPRAVLIHPGDHPARSAARALRIPVLNAHRHYDAGVFTIEGRTGFASVPVVAADRVALILCANELIPVTHDYLAAEIAKASPPIDLASCRDLRGIVEGLFAPLSSGRTVVCGADPVFPIRSTGRGAPLFIVGKAGRRAPRFHDGPVFGIAAPDLDRLARPHTIQHIAAECVRALRSFRPEGPYALGGWRADGVVAIEMARQLEAEGAEVSFVALFGTRDLLLRRVSRVRRWLARVWQSTQRRFRPASDAVAEGLRYYRPYPWPGRVLRIRDSEDALVGSP